MVRSKGEFSGWSPRISTKTPNGNEVGQKAKVGDEIQFNLTQVSKNNEDIYVDEELSLEVKIIYDDYVQLETIPSYLKEEIPTGAELAVCDIHRIVNSGVTLETFEPSNQDTGSIPSGSGETLAESNVDIDYTGPASRELLESITANALDSLGYSTETNVNRITREGPKAEVDVWAKNPRENFSIYVSCKNWDSKVGRPTVDEEVGRVINLRKVPQLRILVVGNLTEDAKKAIEASGFLAITLGEQADEENTEEIYREIHTQLTETLLAIAPPRVEEIADRAETLSQELGKLSDDIRHIGD